MFCLDHPSAHSRKRGHENINILQIDCEVIHIFIYVHYRVSFIFYTSPLLCLQLYLEFCLYHHPVGGFQTSVIAVLTLKNLKKRKKKKDFTQKLDTAGTHRQSFVALALNEPCHITHSKTTDFNPMFCSYCDLHYISLTRHTFFFKY